MKSKLNFHVTDIVTHAQREEVLNGLRQYNHQFVEAAAWQQLGIFVHDDDGQLVAGMIAGIKGLWLSIELLWIDERIRALRLGTQLLLQCEQEAMDRGCRYAQVDTYSFQAMPFYQKNGYELKMTLDDYPCIGQQRHYLNKTLSKN